MKNNSDNIFYSTTVGTILTEEKRAHLDLRLVVEQKQAPSHD